MRVIPGLLLAAGAGLAPALAWRYEVDEAIAAMARADLIPAGRAKVDARRLDCRRCRAERARS